MKKIIENTKKVFIGNTKIELVKAEPKNVVLKITGRENGFVTLVNLTKEQLVNIHKFIVCNMIISNIDKKLIIENIHAKHREYTKSEGEKDFTYKYYEHRDCKLQTIALGGHCILSLRGECGKHYKTISFDIYDNFDSFEKLRNSIVYSMGEAIMKF